MLQPCHCFPQHRHRNIVLRQLELRHQRSTRSTMRMPQPDLHLWGRQSVSRLLEKSDKFESRPIWQGLLALGFAPFRS